MTTSTRRISYKLGWLVSLALTTAVPAVAQSASALRDTQMEATAVLRGPQLSPVAEPVPTYLQAPRDTTPQHVHPNQWVRGGVIGGIVGGAVFAVLGAALCAGLGDEKHSCAHDAGLGFLVGAPIGAFVGALIGSNYPKREKIPKTSTAN